MVEITDKILRYKNFTPSQKLLLMVISRNEINIPPFQDACRLTSQEMGDMIGLTRTKIQDDLWELTELSLIDTKVLERARYTSITKRCINLISKK